MAAEAGTRLKLEWHLLHRRQRRRCDESDKRKSSARALSKAPALYLFQGAAAGRERASLEIIISTLLRRSQCRVVAGCMLRTAPEAIVTNPLAALGGASFSCGGSLLLCTFNEICLAKQIFLAQFAR